MKKPTTPLLIAPNPTRCHRVDGSEKVVGLRRLDCQRYDACLAVAAEGGWRGFHCNGCAAYLSQTPTQRLRDYEATLDMLADTRLLAGLLDAEASGIEDADDDQDHETVDRGVRLLQPRGFAASLDDTGAMPIHSIELTHA